MSIYKTIQNIQDISDIQLEIDCELMENGGELTPELEAKQNSIDGLLNTIVKAGADEVINSLNYMNGNLETLKEMKSNITASVKSAENLIDRIKFNTGALLAKDDIKSLKGLLGSLSVKDKVLIDVFDKDLVENEFKFVLVKFKKEDYLDKEFEIAELIKEVSKKDEVNETLLKKQTDPKGATVKTKKTITAYKKRAKKESE